MSDVLTPTQNRNRRLAILAALWVFVFAVVVVFRSVVLPFAGAALIAYIVAPLVDRIVSVDVGRRTIPRWVAILLIYLVFFLITYLLIITLSPQLYRELARISRDAVAYANSLTPERVQEIAVHAEEWLTAKGLPVDLSSRAIEGYDEGGGLSLSVDLQALFAGLATRVSSFIHDHVGDIVKISRTVVGGVLAAVFMLFFVLMVAAFFSIDVRTIKAYWVSLIPPEYTADVRILVRRIDRSLAGVVRGQLTICVVNGVLTLVGLLLFKVKFAFLLATIATLFSLIPIFGAIISSVPIVLIGLSQSWKIGAVMLVWILGIHALEAYFLNPKIMGSAARIHPIIVAFSLIAGERMFGLVGALFAVPIAAVVVGCFDFARQKAQPPALAPAPTHSDQKIA